MGQLKFYKIAALGLLILNFFVLAFFMFAKPKGPPRNSHTSFQKDVIEMLDLSSEQESAFVILAGDHHQRMEEIRKQQEKLLLPYFKNLADTAIHVDKELVLAQLQELEREKIETTWQHFREIREILSDAQLPGFEQVVRKFIERSLLSRRSRPRGRGF